MAQVQTVRVKVKETGNEVVINLSDFDEALHDKVKVTEAGVDENHLRAIRSAGTVADFDLAVEKFHASLATNADGKRTAKRGVPEEIEKEIELRRAALEEPRMVVPVPKPQDLLIKEPPYEPYMAPPSPRVALRSVGVDPVAATMAAAPLQTKAAGVPEPPAAADDTRHPKGLGLDAGAAAAGLAGNAAARANANAESAPAARRAAAARGAGAAGAPAGRGGAGAPKAPKAGASKAGGARRK